MRYFAKTKISYGHGDGTSTEFQPGDEIVMEGDEHSGLSQSELDQLLAQGSVEETDQEEWSGERPGGPLDVVTNAEGVQGTTLPDGRPATPETVADLPATQDEGPNPDAAPVENVEPTTVNEDPALHSQESTTTEE
jgi:hypothetical protein